jgi:hypothetical protein
MDIQLAISIVPEFADVESDLQMIETICGYAAEKKALKEAMQEIMIMSEGSSVATIKASCKAVMDVIGMIFEREMNEFNDATGASVDTVEIDQFKERFTEEVSVEHSGLKAMSAKVIEMCSTLALALNVPVPATAAAAATPAKPKKTFVDTLKKIGVFEKDAPRTTASAGAAIASWLTEAVLREDAPEVQKLILLHNKYNDTKSVDSVRTFAAKFKMNDAALAELILDVLDDARKQITLSDAIVANVTADYQRTEKIITVLLAKRDETRTAMNFVSGSK